jgi:Zn-finger protein
MKPVSLYEKVERGCRGKRADCNILHEGDFVELLNKEMEELLKKVSKAIKNLTNYMKITQTIQKE